MQVHSASTVYLASDHAGFEMKQELAVALRMKYQVVDLGPHAYDAADDYPDFVRPASLRVAAEGARAIVIGKSGQGEAMCANRIRGVRAAVFAGGDLDLVRLAREHNDANVLSLGAGFLSFDEALSAATVFLESSFSDDDRHRRRISKLDD